MSKLTLFLPKLSNHVTRYQEGDEFITDDDVIVVDDLPSAKKVVQNRLILLQEELKKLKLKDVS